MDIVAKASEFAAAKHEKQRRKYTDQPYFNHLAAVVRVLESNGVTDPTALAAAYLHDTVEDTDTTMQEIVTGFGAMLPSWSIVRCREGRPGEPHAHVRVASVPSAVPGEAHQVRRHHRQQRKASARTTRTSSRWSRPRRSLSLPGCLKLRAAVSPTTFVQAGMERRYQRTIPAQLNDHFRAPQ